jgi:hypothetical protein
MNLELVTFQSETASTEGFLDIFGDKSSLQKNGVKKVFSNRVVLEEGVQLG